MPRGERLFGMLFDQVAINFFEPNLFGRSMQPYGHIESGGTSKILYSDFVNVGVFPIWGVRSVFPFIDEKSVLQEDVGPQVSFRSFVSPRYQSQSSPPQSEREQDQQSIRNLQPMPEDRPELGSLIASIITIILASSIYRRSKIIGVPLGFYGFVGILFGIDIWSLIEWGLWSQ